MRIIPVRDTAGSRYDRLTLIQKQPISEDSITYWLCKCDCGNEVIVKQTNLRRGHTKSCGCLRRDLTINKNTTHGLSSHPLHEVWLHIMQRCNNPKNNNYKYYGGRGITICKEWAEDLATFIAWAEPLWNPDLQIDRIDNEGDYSPNNCRFVTALENSHNKRAISSVNTSGYAGVSLKGRKWAANIRSKLINDNKSVHLGMFETIEEAVATRNAFIIENNLPHKIQEIKS